MYLTVSKRYVIFKCIIKRNLFRLHKFSFITALPTKQSTVLHKPLVTYTHLPRSVIGE